MAEPLVEAFLMESGIRSQSPTGRWSHELVQAQFSAELVNRRKLYPASLRDTLTNTMAVRHTADYGGRPVTERQAARALRWAREFVAAVQGGRP